MFRPLVFLTLLAAAAPAAPAPGAEPPVPEPLRAWLATQRSTGDVRVEFTLTKTLPALKQPVTTTGRFWSHADGRFLWETGKPPASALRYDGTTLEAWEATANRWRKLDPADRRLHLWFGFLSGRQLTVETLSRDFLITAPAAGTVSLEPRAPRDRKQLAGLDLGIDPATHRLVRLLVRQGDGGSQRFDFTKPAPMTPADREAVEKAKGG